MPPAGARPPPNRPSREGKGRRPGPEASVPYTPGESRSSRFHPAETPGLQPGEEPDPFHRCDKGIGYVIKSRVPVKTITCKLRVDDEKRAALDATFDLFNAVCNHLSQIAWQSKTFRPFALHKA